MPFCKVLKPKTGNQLEPNFIALGSADPLPGRIVGFMKKKTSSRTYSGRTITEGPNWRIAFEGLELSPKELSPKEEKVYKRDYTLYVSKIMEGMESPLLDVVGDLAVGEFGRGLAGARTAIICPKGQDQACSQNLIAKVGGEIDDAYVTKAGDPTRVADGAIYQDSHYYWALFPPLNDGKYDLYVLYEGKCKDSVKGLDLKKEYCQ